MSSRTTSLRDALAQSRPADDAGYASCAQRYSHQRHMIVCCVDKQHWLLIIDELVFPTHNLESIERILRSGNLQIPLGDGWLAQAPKNFTHRLVAIRQATKGQGDGGVFPVIVPA